MIRKAQKAKQIKTKRRIFLLEILILFFMFYFWLTKQLIGVPSGWMQAHIWVQVCLRAWRQRTSLGVIPWVDSVTDFGQ